MSNKKEKGIYCHLNVSRYRLVHFRYIQKVTFRCTYVHFSALQKQSHCYGYDNWQCSMLMN